MAVKGSGLDGFSVLESRIAGASAGISLTTTAARQVIPKGTNLLELIPRNFAGGGVSARWGLMPYLIALKTSDSLATATDYSSAAQDGDAAVDVDLSSLPTLALGGCLLIGSPIPIRGLDADVDAVNANASVLSGKYWDGSAWTNIALTDNTANGGKTFAQDGTITWSVPAAWTKATLRETGMTPAAAVGKWAQEPLYWVRLEVSAALDASTTLNALLALPRDTGYAETPSIAGVYPRFPVSFGPGGISGVEVLMDAGTGNLIVNCYSSGGFAQN